MKTKLQKRILGVAACALIAVCALIGVCTASYTASADATYSVVELLDIYELGTEFTPPAASVTLGEESVSAEAVLRYPSGNAYKKESHVLSEEGRYTLTYDAALKGKTYRKSFTFDVCNALYRFSGTPGSTAVYSEEKGGLAVSLEQGATLSFNSIIDLHSLSSADELIGIVIDNTVIGEADFTELTVTLTDIADPDSYVRVLHQASIVGNTQTFVLAGANGQPLTGLEVSTNKTVLHRNNDWGAHMYTTWYATPNFSRRLAVAYDYAENAVYSRDGLFIIDFDNPEYFAKPWSGFTSGKVRVSLSASGYKKSTATFVVDGLFGTDLCEKYARNFHAPTLEIDLAGNDADVSPWAKTGESYKIFGAEATDVYGNPVAVKTEVLFDYGLPGEAQVSVTNDAFTPFRAGRYAIRYTATDSYGNSTVKTVTVTAYDVVSVPVLTPVGMPVTDAVLGESVRLQQVNAVSDDGSYLALDYTVTFGGENIDVDGDTFVPLKIGEYDVEFTATHHIGISSAYTYKVTVTAGDRPLFKDKPEVPKFILAGHEYEMPALTAYDYTHEGSVTEYTADIELIAGGKTYRASGGKLSVPTDISEGEAEIRYVSGNATATYPVNVVNAGTDGSIAMEKYFYGIAATSSPNGVTVAASEESKEFTFVKPLLAENFVLRFSAVPQAVGLSGVRFTLTDCINPQEEITVEFARNGNAGTASINGIVTAEFADYGFTQYAASGDFHFTLTGSQLKFMTDALYTIADFGGFSSGRIYVSGELLTASNDYAAILVTNIDGQPLSDSVTDRIAPKIVLTGDYGGDRKFGDKVLLGAAYANDVLADKVTFTLSVTRPDGSYAVTEDGMALDKVDPSVAYSFVIDAYGDWRVQYEAFDDHNGRVATRAYRLSVNEYERPYIKVAGDTRLNVNVGTTVIIPKAECSAGQIYRYLINTRGNMIEIPENSNSFVAENAGTYRIVYLVYDESNNMSRAEVTVYVS